ncbi:MAG: hypothetical protein NTX24_00045 [Candidatus Pacearchaeota archaeon]|nr:hypothetical protein [Candidatus Pacearchaeota archaeon]
MFDFEEVVIWIVSSIFLGFLMSIKIVSHFLYIDPLSVLLYSAFAMILLFIFIFAQKLVAALLDCSTKTKWLSFKQYWFDDRLKLNWSFPLWLFLPLFLFLITLGKFVWLAILNFDAEPKEGRFRRKWHEISEFDIGKIAVAGPIAMLIVGLILRLLSLTNLAFYAVLLGFLSLIPIGNGFKLLLSSRPLWIFSLVLTGFMVFLISSPGIIINFLMAVFIAFLLLLAWLVLWEK